MENEDEEKKSGQQKNNSVLGEQAGQAKQKADNTKNKVKKIKKVFEFFKKHPLLAKVLFWVALAIIIIMLLVCIIYSVDKNAFSEATMSVNEIKTNIQNLNAGTEDGEEGEGSYLHSGATLVDGTYSLIYGYTEDEKKENVDKMKKILAKKNIEINSNQCLLFLYALQESRKDEGFDILSYNKDKLEAMYMFFKAEIATSSLDLRSKDEMYKEDEDGNLVYNYPENSIVPIYKDEKNKEKMGYGKDSYNEDDYTDDTVYGTIRVQRVTYNEETATSGEIGITSYLTYLQYEEFMNLINAKDNSVLNYFTIDEEFNLIVAGWNSTSVKYELSDFENYTAEEQEQMNIEYDEKEEEESNYNVYKYRSIPYQDYINKYAMTFDFLMALLATTDDEDFCKELAKTAESSYIVITLQEEFSTTTTTTDTDHVENEKIYAIIDEAQCIGTNNEEIVASGNISTQGKTAEQLKNEYHWAEGENKTSTGSASGSSWYGKWTWTYKESDSVKIKYELKATNNGIEYFKYSKSTTKGKQKQATARNLFITQDRKLQKDGLTALNFERNWTAEGGFESAELDTLNGYTKVITKKYHVSGTTVTEANSYKMEITEVDNWYEYYKKTYSEIEPEPTGFPETEQDEKLENYRETRVITEEGEINAIDYIGEISKEEKERVVKETIGQEDLTKMKFNIKKLTEYYYGYGNEHIITGSSGTRYKKGGIEREEVKIKVQKGNDTAYLTISADAIFSEKDDKEEDKEDKEEDDKKEVVYDTTDEYTNGFLNVYDKYEEAQQALNSIDEWTYEMLDSVKGTINTTNLLKYLLFLYDGTDFGVTDYDLTLFKPDEFKSAITNGSAIAEWLKSYEFNNLREFRNGEKTYEEFKNGYHGDAASYDEDGNIIYHMYSLDVKGDNSWNFSYGLRIWDIPSNSLSMTESFLTEAGITVEELKAEIDVTPASSSVTQKGWDADTVDRLMDIIIEYHREIYKEYYESKGITLESYELDACIAIAYGHGNCYADSASLDVLRKYKAGEATKEQVIETFRTESGFKPFTYTAWGRREQLIEMFFEGRYILSTGEEIDPNSYIGGSLLQAAETLHKRMEDENWIYSQSSSSTGLFWGNIESSINKANRTCCATYVSSAIYMSGLATEEEMNSFNYNYVPTLKAFLEKKGWERIDSREELEAGDVVIFYSSSFEENGHVEIYAGDGTWYGAGSTYAVQSEAPSSESNSWLMKRFQVAYRYR